MSQRYLDTLLEAITERDELFEFVNNHVAQLINPIVTAINQYLDLDRGGVDIVGVTVNDSTIVLSGNILSSTGSKIADVFFGVPCDKLLGDEIDVDQLVQMMTSLDIGRETSQRDDIRQVITQADMMTLQANKPVQLADVPSVTELHYSHMGETLAEYVFRNTQDNQRTLH